MDEAGVDGAAGALPDPLRDTRGDHDELVRSRSGELTRLAYLVSGDRERAIALTADALAALRDEWDEVVERGMPQAEARAAVVRGLLPTRRGRSPAVGPAIFAPTDSGGVWDPEGESAAYGMEVDDDLDEIVLSSYAAEPVATRIAIVLGEVDHLDSPAVAGALDRDVRSVDHDVAAGLDRIADARQRAADGTDRGRPSEGVRAQLRRVLVSQTFLAGLPLDLTDEVDALRRRTVRRRRLLTAGLGGLGLAVAGAVGAPALLRQRDRTTLTGAGSNGASGTGSASVDGAQAAPVDLSWDAIWRWPARGSMTNDAAAQAVVRQQQQRVIYAERIDGATLVIGAQHDDNQTDASGRPDPLAALVSINVVGASRTPNGQAGAFGLTGTDPLAVTTALHGPGRLVVLAPPDVASVDVSSKVRFDPDGRCTRIGWVPLALNGGVGQVASPSLGSFGMSVRYAAHHYPPYSSDFGLAGVFVPRGVTRHGQLWDASGIVAAVAARARDVACTLTGLARADVSVTVDHQTTVPGGRFDIFVPEGLSGGADQTYPPLDTGVAVVITALPGGARLRTVAAWHPLAAAASGLPVVYLAEESTPFPATGLERRPVILQSSGGMTPGVGIIAPGATSVRLSGVQLPPGQKATVPVTGGLAVFSLNEWDEAAKITTLDAKGHPLAQWPFSWGDGGAWDLYG